MKTHGKWLRVGPFPSEPKGLAARAEWLNDGAATAALDVAAPSSVPGLPSVAEVSALIASFQSLWKEEQPRSRLVARFHVGIAVSAPSQASALGELIGLLRPHVGAILLVRDI